jgi:predicted RNA-binding protein YlxR (DUF448 family)
LGCEKRDEQGNMLRLVVAENGGLKISQKGGRGGYLHRDRGCCQAFVKKKSVYRAFHHEISKDTKEKLIQGLDPHVLE